MSSTRSSQIADVLEHYHRAQQDGQGLTAADLIVQYPHLMPELEEALREAQVERIVPQAPAPAERPIVDSLDARFQRLYAPVGTPALNGYTIEPVPLGQGGQGTVYVGTQESTRRSVAIKMLTLDDSDVGLDARAPVMRQDSLKRFQREVELIAQLDHPGIVKVFASGTQPQPYYVMEYVEGVFLTQYVKDRVHKTPAIIDLLLKVCEAVQYAHQNGVIHRDLKPGNILVTPDGQPKILDFGLAKQLGAVASITRGPAAVGTLAYMAPEQAGARPGQRTDTRTDSYALGVILYQLLTERLPYALRPELGERAVRDQIVFDAPDDPRQAWRETHGYASRTQRECPIDAELASILLKSLAKESDNRYRDAGALADDLRRYRRGEPVVAVGDSRWYHLRKSVRRYRAPLTIAAAFVVLTIGAAAWLAVLYQKADALRRQAQGLQISEKAARNRAESFSKLLFDAIAKLSNQAPLTPLMFDDVLAMIQSSVGKMAQEGDQGGNPGVEAAVRDRLGWAYLYSADFEKARRELMRARELHLTGADALVDERVSTLRGLGMLTYYERSDIRQARRYFEEAAQLTPNVTSLDHVLDEATLSFEEGRVIEAAELFDLGYAIAQEEAPAQLASLVHDRGYVLVELMDYPSAEGFYRAALDQAPADTPPSDRGTWMKNLGLALLDQGLVDEGALLVERGHALRVEAHGPEHYAIADSLVARGFCDLVRGDLHAAEENYRIAIEMQRNVFETDQHLAIAFSTISLAAVLAEQQRSTEAEALFADGVQMYRDLAVIVHPLAAQFYYYTRAVIHHRAGDLQTAEPLYEQAVAMLQKLGHRAHAAAAMSALGLLQRDAGRLNEALETCAQSLEIRRALLSPKHPSIASGLLDLASVHCEAGNHDRCTPLLAEARDIRSALDPPVDWLVALVQNQQARCLLKQSRQTEARHLASLSFATLRDKLGSDDPRTRDAAAVADEAR